jgi:hypothetical protein
MTRVSMHLHEDSVKLEPFSFRFMKTGFPILKPDSDIIEVHADVERRAFLCRR